MYCCYFQEYSGPRPCNVRSIHLYFLKEKKTDKTKHVLVVYKLVFVMFDESVESVQMCALKWFSTCFLY